MNIEGKEKTCILFSGQSSQYQGMAIEMLDMFPEFNYIFEKASEITELDLINICKNADMEILSKTQIAQPVIMATSLLSYEVVKSLGIKPDMVAGHSLGEYAAMVASGILSMEDGFKVIKERAYAMGECAKNQDGAMCAVIGLSSDEIKKVCEETEGYVIPVNYNSPQQTVIAGESSAVNKATETFLSMGKRAIKLAVSAAFHSKLMQSGADIFVKSIEAIDFKNPTIDFYSNLTGQKLTDFSNMPDYLGRHLASPVKFTDELNSIQQAGAVTLIECGPSKILSGLVKKTLSNVQIYNVEDKKSFEKLKSSLSIEK